MIDKIERELDYIEEHSDIDQIQAWLDYRNERVTKLYDKSPSPPRTVDLIEEIKNIRRWLKKPKEGEPPVDYIYNRWFEAPDPNKIHDLLLELQKEKLDPGYDFEKPDILASMFIAFYNYVEPVMPTNPLEKEVIRTVDLDDPQATCPKTGDFIFDYYIHNTKIRNRKKEDLCTCRACDILRRMHAEKRMEYRKNLDDLKDEQKKRYEKYKNHCKRRTLKPKSFKEWKEETYGD